MTLDNNDDEIPSSMEDLIDFIKRKRRTTGRRVNFEAPVNYFGRQGVDSMKLRVCIMCSGDKQSAIQFDSRAA